MLIIATKVHICFFSVDKLSAIYYLTTRRGTLSGERPIAVFWRWTEIAILKLDLNDLMSLQTLPRGIILTKVYQTVGFVYK